MTRTTNFFLIHNFNTIPTELTELCEDYILYDCSNDMNVKKKLAEYNFKVKYVENTGHNITSYFSYFAENYDHLPEVICLLKGNMIGRHCSMEFFREVYDNKSFTFLYDENSIGIGMRNLQTGEMETKMLWERHFLRWRMFMLRKMIHGMQIRPTILRNILMTWTIC